MVFVFQIKGYVILIMFFLPLLNLYCIYIVSKCELYIKMFKYVTKIKGRALPIFPPHFSSL